MAKRFFSFLLLIGIALSLSACGVQINLGSSGNMVVGSGKLISDTREVSGFSSVSITGSGDATITLAPATPTASMVCATQS